MLSQHMLPSFPHLMNACLDLRAQLSCHSLLKPSWHPEKHFLLLCTPETLSYMSISPSSPQRCGSFLLVFITIPNSVPPNRRQYLFEGIKIWIAWGQHQNLESFAQVIQRYRSVYLTIVFSNSHISAVPTCLHSKAWKISFTEFGSLVLPPSPVSFYPRQVLVVFVINASQILHYLSSLVSVYLPGPTHDGSALLPH